jgi:hypothetical protein
MARPYPLAFKGRVGVGMGLQQALSASDRHPLPASPLKGEDPNRGFGGS